MTLASYSPDDPKLDEIKRSALLPYLQELEEKMIIFKKHHLCLCSALRCGCR